MIGNGTHTHIGQAIRPLTGLHHLIHLLGHRTDMGGDLPHQPTRLLRHVAEIRLLSKSLLQLGNVVEQQALVVHGDGDDVVEREITQHTRLDLHLLDIDLPLHLVACLQLLTGEDTHAGEKFDGLRTEIGIVLQRDAVLAIQSTASRLLFPGIGIAVAIETNRFGGFDIGFQHLIDSHLLALA